MSGVEEYMRTLAREVVMQFQVSSSRARIGVVSFSNDATIDVGLSDSETPVIGAINGIPRASGGTSITSGLLAAKGLLEGASTRMGVPQAILLLTDGRQLDTYGGDAAAIATAGTVRDAHIEIYSTGFGNADEATISSIASAPASQFAFFGDNIQAVADHLAGSFCTLVASPRVPPAPPTPPMPPSPPSPLLPPPPPPSPPMPSPPPVPPPDDDLLVDLDPEEAPPPAKTVELRATAAHYLYFSGSADLVRPGDLVRLMPLELTFNDSVVRGAAGTRSVLDRTRTDCSGAAATESSFYGGVLDTRLRTVVRLPVGAFGLCIAQVDRTNISAMGYPSVLVTMTHWRRLDDALQYFGNWSGDDPSTLHDYNFFLAAGRDHQFDAHGDFTAAGAFARRQRATLAAPKPVVPGHCTSK
jgi:hypothetical protein